MTGIEFAWDKRFSHGLQFQVAYTFSNSEDTTSEATFVGAGDCNQQGPNAAYARAKSRFHTPHRFTFNGSYRLPFFEDDRGFLGQAFGGWMLSGVVKIISGTPSRSRRQASIWTSTDLPKRVRCCSIRRSLVRNVSHRDTSQQALPRVGVPAGRLRRHGRGPGAAKRLLRRRPGASRPRAVEDLPDAVVRPQPGGALRGVQRLQPCPVRFPGLPISTTPRSVRSRVLQTSYSPRVAAARIPLSLLTDDDRNARSVHFNSRAGNHRRRWSLCVARALRRGVES